MVAATQFINCRLCISGSLISRPLTISSSGLIIPNDSLPSSTATINCEGCMIAPGFIELQINGALGFHFAHYLTPETYQAGVEKLARYLPSTGVTGFYPTIPTVTKDVFEKSLPFLSPKDIESGASVLGCHVEGPFINPSKKGAHDAANMHIPSVSSLEDIYGEENLRRSIKILTLAPELPGALEHIKRLRGYGIAVSMGHSAATLEQGVAGHEAGANLITHTFNAMNPLHHREPGLAGLISSPNPPYYSIIADGIHLHPNVVSLAYHASPPHCLLITDSIEMSGLPDGTYPGHAQIPFNQVKEGNKVTIEGTNTLIGTCIGLDECVRNLMAFAEIGIAEAVRCVTENPADAMGLRDRGKLGTGRRADLVILSEDGKVLESWVLGKRIYG